MTQRLPTLFTMIRPSALFPFLEWLPDYQTRHLKSDLFAGLTVALVLIPQSMAYAQLAGLPTYYGLYAAFLPPAIAALFGLVYIIGIRYASIIASGSVLAMLVMVPAIYLVGKNVEASDAYRKAGRGA